MTTIQERKQSAKLRADALQKRMHQKYSPDQPRDDHGRFGTGGGSSAGGGSGTGDNLLDVSRPVVLYHGTVDILLDKILKEGIKISLPNDHLDKWIGHVDAQPRGVYGAASVNDAAPWATETTRLSKGPYSRRAVIFKAVVPEEWLKDDPEIPGARYSTHDIPPSMLKSVIYFEREYNKDTVRFEVTKQEEHPIKDGQVKGGYASLYVAFLESSSFKSRFTDYNNPGIAKLKS
jgi:hypothetical protein